MPRGNKTNKKKQTEEPIDELPLFHQIHFGTHDDARDFVRFTDIRKMFVHATFTVVDTTVIFGTLGRLSPAIERVVRAHIDALEEVTGVELNLYLCEWCGALSQERVVTDGIQLCAVCNDAVSDQDKRTRTLHYEVLYRCLCDLTEVERSALAETIEKNMIS